MFLLINPNMGTQYFKRLIGYFEYTLTAYTHITKIQHNDTWASIRLA